MSSINDVPMVMMLLLSYFFKALDLAHGSTYGRTYARTDSHVTTKILKIDGLPNFLKYGAPPECLRRAGAPLLICKCFVNLHITELITR